MMHRIYSFLLYMALPFFLVIFYVKNRKKKEFRSRWKEYIGVTPKLSNSVQPIWIHAVSVGEVVAASAVVKAIKEHSPKQRIVITTTTITGALQAKKLTLLAEHRFMPLDLPFAINNFISTIRPRTLLIMETELWPNTINVLSNYKIPVIVLNARLSERSFNRYNKIKPIFNSIAKNIELILCQTDDDRRRFNKLGVLNEKLKTVGSLKFDFFSPAYKETSSSKLKEIWGNNRLVWIAVSTHQGEDEVMLRTHELVLQTFPNTLLVLVPRHPERFSDVLSLANEKRFSTVSRTSGDLVSNETQVYIGDTMGEMLTLIGASDVCVMCGSFIGDKVGGHNVLEPAALSVPTIIGPSYYNFETIVNNLNNRHGCVVVASETELTKAIINLLADSNLRFEVGKNARQYFLENTGSINETIDCLEYILDGNY